MGEKEQKKEEVDMEIEEFLKTLPESLSDKIDRVNRNLEEIIKLLKELKERVEQK